MANFGYLVATWLDFSTTTHDNLYDHLVWFGGLGGSFEKCLVGS